MVETERSTVLKTPSRVAGDPDGSGFATFENPRAESVNYHLKNHWSDLRIARVGERDARTQDVVVSCTRCEVRYRLEDLPAGRIPGTEAYERRRS